MEHIAILLIALITGAGIPALLLWLALMPWKQLPADPWTERARRLHSILRGYHALRFIFPLLAAVVVARFYPQGSILAAVIGAIVGGALSSWPLERELYPPFDTKRWLKASVIVSLLSLGWLLLVLGFIFTMPARPGLEHLGWAAGFLAAGSVMSAGLIYRFLVAVRIFRPARASLDTLVRQCAAEAGVTVRSVWEIPTPISLAAAFPVQRAILFSPRMATDFSDEELRCITLHELAHLTEGRLTLALRVLQMPVTLLPFVFTQVFMATFGFAGLFFSLLLWLAAQRLFLRLSVRLETRADKTARHDAESPAFARALERIHRHNLIPAAFGKKAARAHPDLYDRMLAAGVQPDYERPAPPSDWHWMHILGILLSIATMLGFMFD